MANNVMQQKGSLSVPGKANCILKIFGCRRCGLYIGHEGAGGIAQHWRSLTLLCSLHHSAIKATRSIELSAKVLHNRMLNALHLSAYARDL